MSLDEHLIQIQEIQKHLKQCEIVSVVERMVKDNDQPCIDGMTEIPCTFIDSLNKKLHELNHIENKIADLKINIIKNK